MKKNLLLESVTFFLLTTVSIAQTGANSKSKASAGNNIEETIIMKERESWEAYKNKDLEAMKTIYAEDYVSYTPAGSSTLQQEMTDLSSNKVTLESYTIDDPKVMIITKDVAIVRYKNKYKGIYNGKPSANQVYVTSMWVNRGGKWQNISYQETPVAPAP